MKKTFCWILIFMFCIQIAGAISSDMKDSYEPKETIIVKISGNILGVIGKDDVEFRRGHVKVPLEFDIKRLGQDYYLWAIAPEAENNYTLIIEDIETTVSGKVDLVDYEKDFVVSGNLTNYYVRPGFIFTTEKFEIEVFLQEDEDKEITVDFPSEESYTLNPGGNTLDFSIRDVEGTGLVTISFGKYSVPAYIITEEGEGFFERTEGLPLSFEPLAIRDDIKSGDELLPYEIIVTNNGNETLEGIGFEYDDSLFSISPEESFDLEPGENYTFEVGLKKMPDYDVTELIYLKHDGLLKGFFVEIEVEEIDGEEEEEDEEGEERPYCSELGGKLCTAGEVCTGEEELAREGLCCLETCVKEPEKEEGGSIWVGILLAVLLVGIIGFIIWRYKKAGKFKGSPLKRRVVEIQKRDKKLP